MSTTQTSPDQTDVEYQFAQLEAVYRNAPVGLAVLDRELRFRRINDRLAAINGRPAADHIGRTVYEILPIVAEDVKTLARQVFESGKPLIDIPLSGETVDRPGEVRHFIEQWYPLFDAAGTVTGINIVAEEVTERIRSESALRESEARFRAIVEQGAAALAVLEGPDHVYTVVSPTYESWAGAGSLVGRRFRDALPHLAGSAFDRAHDEVYATGEPMTVREAHVSIDRDGDGVPEEYVLTAHYTALRNGDGAVYAITSLVVDVTDQLRIRHELDAARHEAEIARAEAEAANRTKSEFLAVMSHELRTPLNAIGGYAELMEMGIRGPVTAQQREDLRRVQTSQRHLLGLINEVLNYAKLETGAVHYDMADVRVRDALVAAEALVAPQAQAKEIELTVGDCAPWLTVRADAEKVRQILVNLLSNAVKFTDRGGGVELSCEYATVAPSGDPVRVFVTDTGIGIAPDQIERIFEPFVQVRADLTRTAEGTGLGLAISRDLARGMGGDLTAVSTPGAGSTFVLTLPRA